MPSSGLNPHRGYRRWAVGAYTGAGLLTLPTAVLSGGTAARLPILATPSAAAASLERQPTLRRAGVDLGRAHRFRTPSGTGYVVAGAASAAVCIAVPDLRAPATYGVACAARATVERSGLPVELASAPGAAGTPAALAAVVLPRRASTVFIRTAGQIRPLVVADGIVTATIHAPATIGWQGRSGPQQARFAGPFRSADTICGGVRRVAPPIPLGGPPPTWRGGYCER